MRALFIATVVLHVAAAGVLADFPTDPQIVWTDAPTGQVQRFLLDNPQAEVEALVPTIGMPNRPGAFTTRLVGNQAIRRFVGAARWAGITAT